MTRTGTTISTLRGGRQLLASLGQARQSQANLARIWSRPAEAVAA